MKGATRILVAEPTDFSAVAIRSLARIGEVELRACARRELGAAFGSYDIVWIRLGHRIDGSILGARPRTRILAVPATGLDHVDESACRERDVTIVSLRGQTNFLSSVHATAEMTVALLLALLRRIPEAAEVARHGRWIRDELRGRELFGKTAGLVGVGRVGQMVAKLLHAFGMEVIGYDTREDFPVDLAERVATLDELLDRSDVVSIHVQYDDSTHGLIGAVQLARMKADAVLVNTSRGAVVDEAALLAALCSGGLAGAALDVLAGEPSIRADHPLLGHAREHPHLLIVPHLGGNTFESLAKAEEFIADRVVAAFAGLPARPADV